MFEKTAQRNKLSTSCIDKKTSVFCSFKVQKYKELAIEHELEGALESPINN